MVYSITVEGIWGKRNLNIVWEKVGEGWSRERRGGKGHCQFKSDGYILTIFFKTMKSKPNYSDQNWSPKC